MSEYNFNPLKQWFAELIPAGTVSVHTVISILLPPSARIHISPVAYILACLVTILQKGALALCLDEAHQDLPNTSHLSQVKVSTVLCLDQISSVSSSVQT